MDIESRITMNEKKENKIKQEEWEKARRLEQGVRKMYEDSRIERELVKWIGLAIGEILVAIPWENSKTGNTLLYFCIVFFCWSYQFSLTPNTCHCSKNYKCSLIGVAKYMPIDRKVYRKLLMKHMWSWLFRTAIIGTSLHFIACVIDRGFCWEMLFYPLLVFGATAVCNLFSTWCHCRE